MEGRGSLGKFDGYANWEIRLRQFPGKNRLNRPERIPLLGLSGTFPTNTFYYADWPPVGAGRTNGRETDQKWATAKWTPYRVHFVVEFC